MFVSQISERDALESVNSHTRSHYSHIFLVSGIAHKGRNRIYERQDKSNKEQRHTANHYENRGIGSHGVCTLFVHKTKERRFHAERQNNEQKRGVCVYIGYDSVTTR